MEENTKPNSQSSQTPIVGAILLVGLMITGAILLKGTANNNVNSNNNQDQEGIIAQEPRKVDKNEHVLGDPNAKIVVIEYSDTECPFCKVFHFTMHKVLEQTGGKVAWVYRHYPIPQLHQKASYEAEATECAWEQGGNTIFWSYLDQIFTRTGSNDKLPTEELTKIATELKLDVNQFQTCLDSGKYKNKVANDVADGKKSGVRGTPTSFILVDGKVVDMINGAASLETVLAQIYAAEQE